MFDSNRLIHTSLVIRQHMLLSNTTSSNTTSLTSEGLRAAEPRHHGVGERPGLRRLQK